MFTKHIADTEHLKTKDFFKNSPFVSVTCDGTSDYTGDEYKSLFLRSSIHVTERFVSVGKIRNYLTPYIHSEFFQNYNKLKTRPLFQAFGHFLAQSVIHYNQLIWH